jgi:cytochrome P450
VTDIPGTLLLDPGVIEDPYPFYDRLRREAPVWQVPGTNVVIVSSFEAVNEVVGRTGDFSNKMRALLYRDENGLPTQFAFGDEFGEAMAAADPPVHTAHRRAVFPDLVARRMAELEGEMTELADELISKFVTAGGGDFMPAVGNALPIAIISQLIAFRDSDLDALLDAAFASTLMVAVTGTLDDLAQLVERSSSISSWVADELHAGGAPEDSLLTTIARGIAAGDLTDEAGVAILHNLLSAGGESTTSLIGNAVRILAEQTELQEQLRAAPELVPAFVEEVLRLESPFRFMHRWVPADTTLQGVEIEAGSTLLVFYASANRDPDEFDQPDELRLDRDNPKFHVAFGRGIHHCVGASLARLEARVVVTELLRATSSIALDPTDPPERVYSLLVRRHERLPLVVHRSAWHSRT